MRARAVGIAVGTWAALAAFWLLLVDLTALPELITGAVCAAIAAVGSELVRAHGLARSRPVAFPEAKPSPLTAADFLYGAAGTLGALLVAWLGLFGYRLGSLSGQATQPVGTLRALHSGHVGDYVTWLTVGLAAIGGVCALSLA